MATPGHTALQIPKVAPGQAYGAAAAQHAALQAVPAPTTPTGALGAPEAPQAVPFSAPTQLPNEPVTAGSPIGAGPGPEVLPPSMAPSNDPTRQQLAALYRVNPNPDVQRLIELIDAQGR